MPSALPVLFFVITPPRDLATEFLGVFARFEYALKAAGFRTGTPERVKPDWVMLPARPQTVADRALGEPLQILARDGSRIRLPSASFLGAALAGPCCLRRARSKSKSGR